jgi:hypothetical protein
MAVVHRPGPPGVRPDPPGVRPGPPSVRPDPSSVRTGNRQVLEIYVCIRGCSYEAGLARLTGMIGLIKFLSRL